MQAEIYFKPEIGEDLSKVVWGHAVNSRLLLDQALSSCSPIMMLEADVSTGRLKDESIDTVNVPIMAHPPNKTSDLSLERWIQEVIHANKELKKGVKLDFKDQGIIRESFEILKKYSSSIVFPLWLNADIIEGPGGDSATIDPNFFLSLCSNFFPEATLSLGWTTNFLNTEDQEYTNEMIVKMADVLNSNSVNQPVTFSVRACFIGKSLGTLHSLAQLYPTSSFTLWTNSTDEIDISSLLVFQDNIGENRVYFDLSKDEIKKFQEVRDDSSKKLKI